VAEHRAGPACEQRSGLAGQPGPRPVADLVDAAVDRVQSPGRDPVIDRAIAEASATKLPPRHGAMLAGSDLSRRVDAVHAALS
jgi:hypothetical protein